MKNEDATLLVSPEISCFDNPRPILADPRAIPGDTEGYHFIFYFQRADPSVFLRVLPGGHSLPKGIIGECPSFLWSTTTGIQTSQDQVNAATTTMRSNAKSLASNSTILTTRLDYISSMANILQSGSDNLTLADMNEEGANMLMLQTRQSLGTTSLSMGAQAAQSVMRLF